MVDIIHRIGIKAPVAKVYAALATVDRLLALPGPFGRAARLLVPRLYRWLPWSMTERIALVIEL